MAFRYHPHFAVSYGLIVKTKSNGVMLIKRKVPYCVQSFYIYLHSILKQKNGTQKYGLPHNPFSQIRNFFEKEWLPYLPKHDQLDYERFINGDIFEDVYDFPHGQMSSKREISIKDCFSTAFREFREETGYRFSYKKEDIYKYPIVQVHFKGCDGEFYTQFYFIIENVKGLRRCRYFDNFKVPLRSAVKIENWNDDRIVFDSELMSIQKAYRILKQQQYIKTDFKYKLLNKKIPRHMRVTSKTELSDTDDEQSS